MMKNKFISIYVTVSIVLMVFSISGTHDVFNLASAAPDDGIDGYQELHEDWTVTGYEEYSDEIIALYGDLTIQDAGHLILNNCTLMMMSAYLQPYEIIVEDNGILEMYDCYVTDPPDDDDSEFISAYHHFIAREGSTLIIDNSTVRQCGFMDITNSEHNGLFVGTNKGHISNSIINTSIIGLAFEGNNTGFQLENITLSQFGMNALIMWDSQGLIINKLTFENLSESYVMDVQDSSEFRFENITIYEDQVIPIRHSSNFTLKNIIGNMSDGLLNLEECGNFNVQDVTIYGMDSHRTQIDISRCSNATMKNINAYNYLNNILYIRECSNLNITRFSGHNVTWPIDIQDSEKIEISEGIFENSCDIIRARDSNQLMFDNIEIFNVSFPIEMDNVNDSVISNLTIFGLKDYGPRIRSYSNNFTFSNVYIESDSMERVTGLTIESSNVFVSNIETFNTNVTISCSKGNISGEDIFINGAYTADNGIELFSTMNANLSNITLENRHQNGIFVMSSNDGDIRMDKLHIKDSNMGVFIEDSNITFSDLVIDNADMYDLWVKRFKEEGSWVTIMNSTINGVIYLDNSHATCINTTNTTAAWVFGSSTFTRKWWVDVYVDDNLGPVGGATVRIENATSDLEFTSQTGSDGYARNLPITDHVWTSTYDYDADPHRTFAEGSGWFAQNFTPYQVNRNMQVNVTYQWNVPPNPPTNLITVSDEMSNTVLTWDSSTSWDVNDYNIYIAKDYGDLLSYIASGIPNATVTGWCNYTHLGGSEDWQLYWYAVKSEDAENESSDYALAICGDWVVNKTTPQYIDNENIILEGWLVVYGKIQLNDTILNIDSPPEGVFGIMVNNSGSFFCENLTVKRAGFWPYHFNILPDALVKINGSVIERPGIDVFEGEDYTKGIRSYTRNLTITNTSIEIRNFGLGIYHASDFLGTLYNISFSSYSNYQAEYFLEITGSSGVKVGHCIFGTEEKMAKTQYGIYAYSSSELNISYCDIWVYTEGASNAWGIYLLECTNSFVSNNMKVFGNPSVQIIYSVNIVIEATNISSPHDIGISCESSWYTTIRECYYDPSGERPDIGIYTSWCRETLIENMVVQEIDYFILMENESGSSIRNIDITMGDVGIVLKNSDLIYLYHTYIHLISNGMWVIGCSNIYLINTTINLTLQGLSIQSPGPINIINSFLLNCLGGEIIAEGYMGQIGDVIVENSTLTPISDESIILNNSAVVYLLNTTFNLTKLRIDDAASRVEIYHYLSIQVYDIDNNIPLLAEITILNVINNIIFEKQAAFGFAEWILIHEKTIFKEDEYSDNPHHIYVFDGSHYGDLEVEINQTGQVDVHVSNQLPWVSGVDIKGYFDNPDPIPDFTDMPTTKYNIVLNYIYQDPENDPESGTIIHWYINGVYNSTFDNIVNISYQYTQKGQLWQALVFPSDGYNSTYPTYPFESNVIGIHNTPPKVSNVTISPSDPIGDNILYVDYDVYDLDGDGLDSSKTTHKWYYYNGTIGDWVYSNIDSFYLPSLYTSKNQQWKCEVTPYDGDEYGAAVDSSIVTIGNSVPEVSVLTILPENPISNETLFASYNFIDPDDDLESGSIIQWFRNDEEQLDLSGSIFVDPSKTAKGDKWYYIIIPSDGEDFGAQQQSDPVYIGNTPPRVSNITILPDNPTTADEITVEYDFYDDDGDGEGDETIIKWLLWSGVEFTDIGERGKTLFSASTVKDQIWTCEILPHDGTGHGYKVRATMNVTIMNSKPTASNILITPSNPTTITDLVANYSYSDLDNDMENGTQIIWYLNDTAIPDLNNQLTVPNSMTQKGQVWYFTVRPKDGVIFGDVEESQDIRIENSPPTATNLTITPDSPLGDHNLTASYTFVDKDGDSEQNPEIRWYDNVFLQTIYNDKLEVDSTSTEKGELWYFTLKVFDGEDYSEILSSHYVIIENSKPVVKSFSPSSSQQIINETDSLEFFVDAEDPDGDILLFKWKLGKTTVSNDEYYLFETDYESADTYTLNLTVQDMGERSGILYYEWKITVENVNRLPEIKDPQPIEKDLKMKEETSLKFSISVSDPDTEDIAQITWYIDDVEAQTGGSTYTYSPGDAAIGKHVVSAVVGDGTDSVEYEWNLTVKDVASDLILGLNWDQWSIILEILVIAGTALLAFIGYNKIKRKKGALKTYMTEIDEISGDEDLDSDECEEKLNELEGRINQEFMEGKIEDLHYLMLQDIIGARRGEMRKAEVTRKFEKLPKWILKELDEMLKDGKISRKEYEGFVATISKTKTLTSDEKKELSKIIGEWEDEDKESMEEESKKDKIEHKEPKESELDSEPEDKIDEEKEDKESSINEINNKESKESEIDKKTDNEIDDKDKEENSD